MPCCSGARGLGPLANGCSERLLLGTSISCSVALLGDAAVLPLRSLNAVVHTSWWPGLTKGVNVAAADQQQIK